MNLNNINSNSASIKINLTNEKDNNFGQKEKIGNDEMNYAE